MILCDRIDSFIIIVLYYTMSLFSMVCDSTKWSIINSLIKSATLDENIILQVYGNQLFDVIEHIIKKMCIASSIPYDKFNWPTEMTETTFIKSLLYVVDCSMTDICMCEYVEESPCVYCIACNPIYKQLVTEALADMQ